MEQYAQGAQDDPANMAVLRCYFAGYVFFTARGACIGWIRNVTSGDAIVSGTITVNSDLKSSPEDGRYLNCYYWLQTKMFVALNRIIFGGVHHEFAH
jgi:hypothetical protein